jgi:hypothetical protein
MSESKIVEVEGLTSENATLLLAAAEELDLDQSVVATTSFGHFLVPEEVAKKAGVDYRSEADVEKAEAEAEAQRQEDLEVLKGDAQREAQADADEADEAKKAPRRRAAKKTAAKE